jgi:carboxymethylenebutenolidase
VELVREWVSYKGPAGIVPGLLVRPRAASGPLPGVIVIQEVWGVDGHIADVTERFASAGYVALAPDLYGAGGGRPQVVAPDRVEQAKHFLDTLPPGQWMELQRDEQRRAETLGRVPGGRGEQVGETLAMLFGGVQRDREKHLGSLEAALGFLGSHVACGGRPVASVGYCMGGSLSAQLAVSSALAAAVIYYGTGPDAEQVAQISCPIRGFYGREDARIVAGLPDFAAALAAAGIDHELRIYPDTGHAFFNDTRPSYRPEAARDDWARTLAFLAATLDPVGTVPLEGVKTAV